MVTGAFAGLRHFTACQTSVPTVPIPPLASTLPPPDVSLLTSGLGPLITDPQKILNLPAGFSYQVISKSGVKMADGLRMPSAPDGMAAFPGPDGLTLVVRNHEISLRTRPTSSPLVPSTSGGFGDQFELLKPALRSRLYDDGGESDRPCMGGTTTLVYDTRKQTVVREFMSLAGTLRNCAGGLTPWNSWITCEETVDRKGKYCAQDHGYCFEVPATAEPGLVQPIPLKAMGRFNHEAIAVDPRTGHVYETEDRMDGLLYRFTPDQPGKLAAGGKLQAMALWNNSKRDLRNGSVIPVLPVGGRVPVRWIDLDNVESPKDDLRTRGYKAGALRFARGEGMWYGNGMIYFACTAGGRALRGQIWRYHPSSEAGTGELELFIEPNHPQLVDMCDNITLAPWGDLILCEDGTGDQFLVGVTAEGKLYPLAKNAQGKSEFAGATFSPDGSTLFVNIQSPGWTLAVTGPWPKSPVTVQS